MKTDKLKKLLEKTGYPVAYDHFIYPQPLPYIAYLRDQSRNFSADNRVYYKVDSYRIELYTAQKDQEAEKKIENLLDEAGIYYDAYESWIDGEKMFMVMYLIMM